MQEKLPRFLRAVPSAECAKGGVGGYNNALQLDASDPTGIAGLSAGQVVASSFRTYYVPLNTQQNFIDAYQVTHYTQTYTLDTCNLSWEWQPMLPLCTCALAMYSWHDYCAQLLCTCVLGFCDRVALTAVVSDTGTVIKMEDHLLWLVQCVEH